MQPIGRTVRYPFDGKPRTREETDDNGNLAYRLKPRLAHIAIADLCSLAVNSRGAHDKIRRRCGVLHLPHDYLFGPPNAFVTKFIQLGASKGRSLLSG
jgi:hypothetical protein